MTDPAAHDSPSERDAEPLDLDAIEARANASRVESLSKENEILRAQNAALLADRTKSRAATVRSAAGWAGLLALLAGCVAGVGAIAKTCAYGSEARRNAEREGGEHYRRTRGVAPFAAVCSPVTYVDGFDHECFVYGVAGDPRPVALRCDGDPPRWNEGCHEASR